MQPDIDTMGLRNDSKQGFAVVITFHPDELAMENLRALALEFGRVLVVDNGSAGNVCEKMAAFPGVTVLALGRNLGVAAALNRGFARAAELGAKWVVTFDQDSRPQPGFLEGLRSTASRWNDVWMVGPRIAEAALEGDFRWLRPHPRWPSRFQRVSCTGEDLPDVSMVVTSGALTSVEAWRQLGGFDERLFIDFVDTDFCLRVREAGRRVAVSAGASLEHHLGHRERRALLGMVFHPTHHSPLRHYYIARNRWPMLRRHARRESHWAFFETMVAGLWLFRVLAFERQRLLKLQAMLLGTWDGLRGRSGPCPPEREKTLTR